MGSVSGTKKTVPTDNISYPGTFDLLRHFLVLVLPNLHIMIKFQNISTIKNHHHHHGFHKDTAGLVQFDGIHLMS